MKLGNISLYNNNNILNDYEVIETYVSFIKCFQNKEQNNAFYYKTFKTLLDELVFVSVLLKKDFWENFGVYVKIDNKTKEKINKNINKMKNKIKYNDINEFINTELNSNKIDKLKTEILLKILLYKNDYENIALFLGKNIKNIMQNSNINVVENINVSLDDISSDVLIEIIKGLKTYKERITNGHIAKILRYIDVIIRNIVNVKNKQNFQSTEGKKQDIYISQTTTNYDNNVNVLENFLKDEQDENINEEYSVEREE